MANVDYKAIADDIAANNAGTVEGVGYEVEFARMSAETVTADKDIQTSDIKAYLTLVDKRLVVEEGATDSAKKARLAFDDFESFKLTDAANGAAYKARLEAVIDGLVTDVLIDATDKAAIMGMGSEVVPKWPNLTLGNVQTAILRRLKGVV